MNRYSLLCVVMACIALALHGCDYSAGTLPPAETFTRPDVAANPAAPAGNADAASAPQGDADPALMKPALLESVISLIRTAALKPGGPSFQLVINKLNTYFSGTPASEFALSSEAREYITKELPLSPDTQKSLELSTFGMPDVRHLEDSMMYSMIATRVAGTGEDLTRVRRLFDWMVRQVQLVPVNSLALGAPIQAQVRPYDALLRGMATEDGDGWSERGWLFMALCRQIGIDVGILTYMPKDAKADTAPKAWICAVLIDGKLYLFDPRLGMAIPGPSGEGVATLEDALNDPQVLGRLDVPGQQPYRPTHAVLSGSKDKIGILIDSSLGFVSPRFRLLEQSLAGKDRTILYRDPIDQRDRFAKALGSHGGGGVKFWPLPLMVQTYLFTKPEFVDATIQSLFLFRPEFPLIYARVKQLRGELDEAKREYMVLRYAENPILILPDAKKHPRRIPPEIQQAMDMCATYFLAEAHLEQGNNEQAARFFQRTLDLLPAPGPNRNYYNMFRWGAQTNLGLLHDAKGESSKAIAYYAAADPTFQHHGNLLRCRELILRNPTAPLPAPLPAPPPDPTENQAPAVTPAATPAPTPAATPAPATPEAAPKK